MSEVALREVWALPFKSQEFAKGPELVQQRGKVELRLDHETEGGGYEWTAIRFQELHAISFTAWRSCTRDQVRAYDRLVEVDPSGWVASLASLPKGVKHYRVFFDEWGCYDVIAQGFAVADD